MYIYLVCTWQQTCFLNWCVTYVIHMRLWSLQKCIKLLILSSTFISDKFENNGAPLKIDTISLSFRRDSLFPKVNSCPHFKCKWMFQLVISCSLRLPVLFKRPIITRKEFCEHSRQLTRWLRNFENSHRTNYLFNSVERLIFCEMTNYYFVVRLLLNYLIHSFLSHKTNVCNHTVGVYINI